MRRNILIAQMVLDNGSQRKTAGNKFQGLKRTDRLLFVWDGKYFLRDQTVGLNKTQRFVAPVDP